MQQHNSKLGHAGENKAVEYLISNNFLIQARNVQFPSGEIDIIAIDVALQELAFVEVKTRAHTHLGHPSHAWNWKKLRAVRSAAMQYLRLQRTQLPYRFDLITITPHAAIHYQNITI